VLVKHDTMLPNTHTTNRMTHKIIFRGTLAPVPAPPHSYASALVHYPYQQFVMASAKQQAWLYMPFVVDSHLSPVRRRQRVDDT